MPFKLRYTIEEKTKVCRECGRSFLSYPSSNRKSCSNACRFAWQKKHPLRYWLGKKRPEVKQFFTTRGKKMPLSVRLKLSKLRKGCLISAEQRGKISRTLMGHPANPGSGRGKSGWRIDLPHYCRSRWEANVARTFLYEGLEYRYEPTRFHFGEFTYTPDFYLPQFEWYVEVCGYITEDKKRKIKAFQKLGKDLLVFDVGLYKELEVIYSELIPNWETPKSDVGVFERPLGVFP